VGRPIVDKIHRVCAGPGCTIDLFERRSDAVCCSGCCYDRVYHATHRDESLIRSHAWRDANPERARYWAQRWSRKWVDENPEANRARSAQWVKDHPEEHRAHNQRRRALQRSNGPCETFLDLEIFDRDMWICQICDLPVDQLLRYPDPMSVSLDHIIPIVKGGVHTKANVQTSHALCTWRKSDS
jgi:hypothetical protein